MVAEEVEIDRPGGSPANDGQLRSNLVGVEHRAGERSESSRLCHRNRQLGQRRSRHRRQNNRQLDPEQIKNATIPPRLHFAIAQDFTALQIRDETGPEP